MLLKSGSTFMTAAVLFFAAQSAHATPLALICTLKQAKGDGQTVQTQKQISFNSANLKPLADATNPTLHIGLGSYDAHVRMGIYADNKIGSMLRFANKATNQVIEVPSLPMPTLTVKDDADMVTLQCWLEA